MIGIPSQKDKNFSINNKKESYNTLGFWGYFAFRNSISFDCMIWRKIFVEILQENLLALFDCYMTKEDIDDISWAANTGNVFSKNPSNN